MKILNLKKAYQDKYVLDGVSFDVKEGEILCILGRSGVGKTTLLNALAGLIDYEGEIVPKAETCSYIFQEPRLLPALSVKKNLTIIGASEEAAEKMLESVELLDKANEKPSVLSGGEKQRVSIARAFLSDSPLMLMDEPFSSLDTALKIRLTNLFARLWEESGGKKSCVFVTHDIEECLMLADRVILLSEGKIALDLAFEKGEKPRPYGKNLKERELLLNAILKE